MARRIAESGRRGPVERFAGLKTRIGNLDETVRLDLDLGEGKGEWEGGEWRKRGERGVEGGAESQQDGRA